MLFGEAVKANILEEVSMDMMGKIYPEFQGLIKKYPEWPIPAYYYM